MDNKTPSSQLPLRWVIMGVCGCGKSEIGKLLALQTGHPFIEGDAYHSQANLDKMTAGIPLNDADRAEWIACLQQKIAHAYAQGSGIVLSCSALKRQYRDILRTADADLRFVHLSGSRELIASRMQARSGHYMPLSLLDSQLHDLQPLQADEAGCRLDITQTPEQLINQILNLKPQQDQKKET